MEMSILAKLQFKGPILDITRTSNIKEIYQPCRVIFFLCFQFNFDAYILQIDMLIVFCELFFF